jgi:hypothetical protein
MDPADGFELSGATPANAFFCPYGISGIFMNPLHRSIFFWFCRNHQSLSRQKAPRIRPAIEHLEGRLNPAPVASLPQLLDIPHSLVVLSPDIASQVPVAEYAGARVLTLDPTRDAISQISASLAGQSSVTSLRVIGHGQPGSLNLAGQTINLATLQARLVEVAGWASHLTPDADILLYGCSVASTAGGRAFVNTLANLTGADVAASTDPTGAGGNLILEYTTGGVADHLQASSQAWTKSGLQLLSASGYNYVLNSGGTSVTITGYTGSFNIVTIPGTLGGLRVTAIGNSAFEGITRVVSVRIPSTVTSIGERAFFGCSGLRDLTNTSIPSGVTSIGNSAFERCTRLTGVTIPSSVTSIGKNTFRGCDNLTSVTIRQGVTSIGDSAFASCQSLTSVTIPSSVTSIGERAFGACSKLTSVTIPSGVTSIESHAFSGCSNLMSVTIPSSVTSIGAMAFYNCIRLTSVTIPSGVTSIGSHAFYDCSNLMSVTIPSSVTSIGIEAFRNCTSLTSVTIPSSVTSIGNGAFRNCSSLTTINAQGNAPALVGTNVFSGVPATAILYYTSGTTGWTNPWAGVRTVEGSQTSSSGPGGIISINPGFGFPTVDSNKVAAPFSLAAGSSVASLGNGKIGIWSATGDYQAISPFPGYSGTLNVNTVKRADGQNADTIVVAVAGRGSPHVLTIDSATGRVNSSFYAFDPGFFGGVTVAGGVTRIGGEITSVILCGAGSGSSPSVSVFNAVTSQPMGAFYAFSNQYLGGVRVALSELDADGTSFAIIGSTINSHVVAFDLNDYYNPILSFNAFPDNFTPQGVYVASGDLDDDNLNEMVVGAGKGSASPQVAVFGMDGKLKKSFNAFDMSLLGGVRVGVADFNKDGKLDILAASGFGAPGTLNVFNYDNLALVDSVFISDSTLGSDVASNFSRV